MAKPNEKECKNAFQKLQDYLPDGTLVRMDCVKAGEIEFYQIIGGYVVEKNGEKFYDPNTEFILMCLDPVGIVLMKPQKVLLMKSLGGAVQWIIDSFKEGGFKMESSEIERKL